MAVVIQNQKQNTAGTLPISEQNKIITWLLGKVKESDIFENYEVVFNDLRNNVSNVGIVLLSGAKKSSQDVCGGYDAVIPFAIILRNMDVASDNSRLNSIDLVNQIGSWFDENIVRDKSIEGYTIYNVTQRTQAVIDYRDESGVEDTSAEFYVNYSKN